MFGSLGHFDSSVVSRMSGFVKIPTCILVFMDLPKGWHSSRFAAWLMKRDIFSQVAFVHVRFDIASYVPICFGVVCFTGPTVASSARQHYRGKKGLQGIM